MNEFWKALPGWGRLAALAVGVILALWIVFAVIGAIIGIASFLFGFVFKALVIVALAAAVVVLVKKATR
ncbi:hypothetical protein [Streptacidiphilus monticola]|jgi:hypothetical protein|uniref:DUF5326 family protein n=1 Tax=Streptacidiphilus monticola TaxID=2161674 RepID=A0ABW1G0I3_9ACTN